MDSKRWIIVSNRLPFDKDAATGKLVRSSGGLIAAITGIKTENEKVWVGAAPPDLTSEEWKQNPQKSKSLDYEPIFISKKSYETYYNDVSNDVLWPLFHYESARVKFEWKAWEVYRKVNERFAEAIHSIAKSGDLVWIHDYHLFLVPYFLKRRNPKIKTGFFLHIPFPSSEIFRQLPVREEILLSLLSSDLVGFHDYSYLRHFCSSLLTVLGIESSLLRVDMGNRTVRLGVFPVGIDTQKFQKEAKSTEVKKLVRKFKSGIQSEFLVLGVDRLDYSKGIIKKLRAFREMLRKHPDLRGKVSLLQIAVPSRIGVPEYNQIKSRIDMLVGEINGEFGKVDYVPIHYLFSSVSFPELLALYRLADILLVTSKRDGMNLVALEYLAAQDPSKPGEVLLSEFTGAISTLSHVVSINPWDTLGTGNAIADALRTSPKERIPKYQVMMGHLENYTATHWAKSFMYSLEVKTELIPPKARVDIQINKSQVVLPDEFKERIKKSNLLMMLDYDGTLTPIVESPEDALLPRKTASVLKSLLSQKNIEIVVVSGRDSQFLGEQLKDINVSMAAEHGAKFYSVDKKRWQSLVHTDKRMWYSMAYQIMEDYTGRVPGSFVEKKEYALSWHYRKSPADFANYQARKLEEDLQIGLANIPVTVLPGKKIVEVRAMEANKGSFARWYLDTYGQDAKVIIAIGDDRTDEDLFASLPEDSLSIKVGAEETRAMYKIGAQEDLVPFLSELGKLSQ